jgi:hypothetical protein
MKKTLLLALTLSAFIFACKEDTKEDIKPTDTSGCDTSFVPSYASKVQPILNDYCIGCHSSNNATAGIALDNFNSSKNNANKLIPAITHPTSLPSSKKMPPGGKLKECDIVTIQRWVNSGFPE